jgi:hypothetical protein
VNAIFVVKERANTKKSVSSTNTDAQSETTAQKKGWNSGSKGKVIGGAIKAGTSSLIGS